MPRMKNPSDDMTSRRRPQARSRMSDDSPKSSMAKPARSSAPTVSKPDRSAEVNDMRERAKSARANAEGMRERFKATRAKNAAKVAARSPAPPRPTGQKSSSPSVSVSASPKTTGPMDMPMAKSPQAGAQSRMDRMNAMKAQMGAMKQSPRPMTQSSSMGSMAPKPQMGSGMSMAKGPSPRPMGMPPRPMATSSQGSMKKPGYKKGGSVGCKTY